jgi:hypothetical protein
MIREEGGFFETPSLWEAVCGLSLSLSSDGSSVGGLLISSFRCPSGWQDGPASVDTVAMVVDGDVGVCPPASLSAFIPALWVGERDAKLGDG